MTLMLSRQAVSPSALVAGPPFEVLNLSPVWWLDADDTATITESANLVSQWDDKSGAGVNVAQATGTAKPTTNVNTINGKNVINFDGTTDTIAASASISLKQLFFVATAETGIVSFSGLINQSGADLENIRMDGVTFNLLGNGRTGENAADFTSASGEMRINGVVSELTVADTPFIMSAVNPNAASTFIPQLSQPFLGRFWKGDIAEVIGFSSELSALDRAAVQNYLSNKWGIALA